MTDQTPLPGNAPGLPHVPAHVRNNFDNTDACLIRLEGLTKAAVILWEEVPHLDRSIPEAWGLSAVLDEMLEKFRDLEKLRAMEWVGHGGAGTALSDDEQRKARGAE